MNKKKKKRLLRPRLCRYSYAAVASCGCIVAACAGRKQARRQAARFAGRMMAAGYQVQPTPVAEMRRSSGNCQCVFRRRR